MERKFTGAEYGGITFSGAVIVYAALSRIFAAAAASVTWDGFVTPIKGMAPFATAHAMAIWETDALCSAPMALISSVSLSS